MDFNLLQWNLKVLQKLQLLVAVQRPSCYHGWKKIGCNIICCKVATYASLDSMQYPKMPVCLHSLLVQLLQLAPLRWFPSAAIAFAYDTGVHKSFNPDGVQAEIFSEWFLPVEHTAARDKLVLRSKGAFKTRPLSAGALPRTELLLGACCGLHCAVDYFLLRKRWKQASSSVMKDLLFVLHAVLPRYYNELCL